MLCLISARRKHPAPNSSGKRGMGSKDSHGSIHQAHSPSAQSEAGARPMAGWGKCKQLGRAFPGAANAGLEQATANATPRRNLFMIARSFGLHSVPPSSGSA